MNSITHLMFSLGKSGIRMFGCIIAAISKNIYYLVLCLFMAEILGIFEELGDKR